MKRWSIKSSTIVLLVSGIACIALIGSGVGYANERNKQGQQQAVQSEIDAHTDLVKENGEIAEKVDGLFAEKKSYLAENLTEEKIVEVEKLLQEQNKAVKDLLDEYTLLEAKAFNQSSKKLAKKIAGAKEKLAIQELVNALFEGKTSAINGTAVNTDLVVAKESTDNQISDISKKIEDKDSGWEKSIGNILANASRQTKQIDKAKQAVNALFDGNNVKENVAEDQYNKANTEVAKIKNETIKKELSDKLAAVKAKLDEKKAAEAAAQEAEETAAEEDDDSISDQSDGINAGSGGFIGGSSNPSAGGNSANNSGNSGNSGSGSSNGGSGSSNSSGGGTSGGSDSGTGNSSSPDENTTEETNDGDGTTDNPAVEEDMGN